MRVIVKLLMCLLVSLLVQKANAQNDSIAKEKELLEKIRFIENMEKDKLKKKIAKINANLVDGIISKEEAEKQKKEAAKFHAKNIEDRIAVAKHQFAFRNRNDRSIRIAEIDENIQSPSHYRIGRVVEIRSKRRERRYDIRTHSDLDIAFGLNHALIDGVSLDDSPYEIGGSRFFEIGWKWRTRVFKNSNFLRLVYGVQIQFNGLRMKNNQYLVDNSGKTELTTHPYKLNKAKFRRDNLVFPLYFELGPSRRIESKNRLRFSTWRKFKLGLGGFAGVNISTRQKLKYNGDDGAVKEKFKGQYNTNNFVYGLAAYMHLWEDVGLYARYNFNTIFDDTHVSQNNIAIGLRMGL